MTFRSDKPLKYWHTLRSLRRGQLLYRLLRLAERSTGLDRRCPKPAGQAELDREALARLRIFMACVARSQPQDNAALAALRTGRFTFLGETVHWPNGPLWAAPERPRLWRYQLHYCDHLRQLATANVLEEDAEDARLAQAWLHSWIQVNPPGTDVAWDPYVIACRLINWAAAFAVFGPPEEAQANSFAMQTSYLRRHLEWDVLGNHLLKDAVALAVAEAVLTGRCQNLDLLRACLAEQIREDGGHYERSLMYHSQILFDLLLLSALLPSPPEFLLETAARMTAFLAAITYPDGEIPLFGDAALGEAPPPQTLATLAAHVLGPSAVRAPVADLAPSGYHLLHSGKGHARLVAKCGPPGPAYQLAHAHCDAMSFEVTCGTQRIIVDSGTHGYAESCYREYCRSTRAHNTVCINQEEQLECWKTFRVARRYTWQETQWDPKQGRLTGRYQLPSGALHRRCIRVLPLGWEIEDTVGLQGPIDAESYLHFHPEVRLEASEAGTWRARWTTGSLLVRPAGTGHVSLHQGETAPHQGWYCPRFGQAIPAPVLRMTATGHHRLHFGYTLELEGAPKAEGAAP